MYFDGAYKHKSEGFGILLASPQGLHITTKLDFWVTNNASE